MGECMSSRSRLVTTAVVCGSGFIVEGVLFFMVVTDLVSCEHVVRFLLGLVVCVAVVSWTLLWMKRAERLRSARRREYLLKDRPPARQHRVHPLAFEPASAVDAQPLTYTQLFEPDQLLKTLLPRRPVALCEVHQYNTEGFMTEKEFLKERSNSLPLLSPFYSSVIDYVTVDGDEKCKRRWDTN